MNIESSPKQNKRFILFSILAILIGLIVSVFASYNIINDYTKSKTFKEVEATVVDNIYNTDGLSTYVIEYEIDGETYKNQGNVYTSTTTPVGRQMIVLYNEKNPSEILIKGENSFVIFLIVGLAFFFIGILFFKRELKKYKNYKNNSLNNNTINNNLKINNSNGLSNNKEILEELQVNNSNILNNSTKKETENIEILDFENDNSTGKER